MGLDGGGGGGGILGVGNSLFLETDPALHTAWSVLVTYYFL